MRTCFACDAPANAQFDTPVYADPRHTVASNRMGFCSETCKRVCFREYGIGVFECANCKRVIFDEFGWAVDGAVNIITCPPCYGRQLLKTGQPRVDFETSYYYSHMPDDKWVSDFEFTAANYTRVAVVQKSFEINALAIYMFEHNQGVAVIAQAVDVAQSTSAIRPGNPAVVYARPSPECARLAIVTICAAWRYRKGSAIGRLSRDVLGLLAQAVWATRFDRAWLHE